MKRSLNVLITGVGSTTALSVIKGLRKQHEFKVFIIGTDTNERCEIAGAYYCDKFFRVPYAAKEKRFICRLIDIVNSESIDLLIPIVDIELEIIARNRAVIEESAYLLLSSYDSVIKCNDKFKTSEFFNKSNIPTIETILVGDIDNVRDLVANSNIDFPLIAKPRKGVGTRDVYEIQSEEELFLVRRIKDPIIQKKAMGQEYTIDVFCDGEKLVSAVPRLRIETRDGISYKGQTEKDEILTGYAKRIAELLRIKGPANIQCFKNGNDVRFFEVNPRFSGSLPLTIEAGVNTPLLALKMALGEELGLIEDFKTVKMCRYWEEVFFGED